jgi:hypothetical protein
MRTLLQARDRSLETEKKHENMIDEKSLIEPSTQGGISLEKPWPQTKRTSAVHDHSMSKKRFSKQNRVLTHVNRSLGIALDDGMASPGCSEMAARVMRSAH